MNKKIQQQITRGSDTALISKVGGRQCNNNKEFDNNNKREDNKTERQVTGVTGVAGRAMARGLRQRGPERVVGGWKKCFNWRIKGDKTKACSAEKRAAKACEMWGLHEYVAKKGWGDKCIVVVADRATRQGKGWKKESKDKKAPVPDGIKRRMLKVAEHGDILPAAKEQVGDHYYLLNQGRMAFAGEVAATLDVRGHHGGKAVQEAVGGTPGVTEEAGRKALGGALHVPSVVKVAGGVLQEMGWQQRRGLRYADVCSGVGTMAVGVGRAAGGKVKYVAAAEKNGDRRKILQRAWGKDVVIGKDATDEVWWKQKRKQVGHVHLAGLTPVCGPYSKDNSRAGPKAWEDSQAEACARTCAWACTCANAYEYAYACAREYEWAEACTRECAFAGAYTWAHAWAGAGARERAWVYAGEGACAHTCADTCACAYAREGMRTCACGRAHHTQLTKMARVVATWSPDAIIYESVAELLEKGRRAEQGKKVLAILKKEIRGYKWRTQVVKAEEVGDLRVRRDRAFITAVKEGLGGGENAQAQ